jgi:hypothetical protein
LWIASQFTGNEFLLEVQVKQTETIKEVKQAILKQSQMLYLGKSPEFKFFSGKMGDKEEVPLLETATIEYVLNLQFVENIFELKIYVKKLCKRKRPPRWK